MTGKPKGNQGDERTGGKYDGRESLGRNWVIVALDGAQLHCEF